MTHVVLTCPDLLCFAAFYADDPPLERLGGTIVNDIGGSTVILRDPADVLVALHVLHAQPSSFIASALAGEMLADPRDPVRAAWQSLLLMRPFDPTSGFVLVDGFRGLAPVFLPTAVMEQELPRTGLVLLHLGRSDIYVIGSTAIVGRSVECGLRLVEDSVSRKHARLDYERGHWRVRDLSSAGGTYVDRNRDIEGTVLRIGMVVRIGTVALLVVGGA